MRGIKKYCVILLASVVFVSCSPQRTAIEESGLLSAEPVSVEAVQNPYGPLSVYELNALDEDFLEQSVRLPYYENITSEQLEYNSSHGAQAYKGASAGVNCDPDGSDIEIVYYVPGYRLDAFSVDGEVIYTSGVFESKGGYFTAYDMSSGVEMRVFAPIWEYHYPGEYGYHEDWLRAFRW